MQAPLPILEKKIVFFLKKINVRNVGHMIFSIGRKRRRNFPFQRSEWAEYGGKS